MIATQHFQYLPDSLIDKLIDGGVVMTCAGGFAVEGIFLHFFSFLFFSSLPFFSLLSSSLFFSISFHFISKFLLPFQNDLTCERNVRILGQHRGRDRDHHGPSKISDTQTLRRDSTIKREREGGRGGDYLLYLIKLNC